MIDTRIQVTLSPAEVMEALRRYVAQEDAGLGVPAAAASLAIMHAGDEAEIDDGADTAPWVRLTFCPRREPSP